MDSRAAIRTGIDMAQFVASGYLADLSDDDLMRRPHPGCNHLKWQVGHLISSEHQMLDSIRPGAMPALPDGFVERYTKETAASDDPSGFDSKEVLLQTAQEQRAGTLAVLETLTDEQLDEPAPEHMRSYAPTVGAAMSLQGSHWMMHVGQWVIVRRELGHAALF